jgi:hypothetical protein
MTLKGHNTHRIFQNKLIRIVSHVRCMTQSTDEFPLTFKLQKIMVLFLQNIHQISHHLDWLRFVELTKHCCSTVKNHASSSKLLVSKSRVVNRLS